MYAPEKGTTLERGRVSELLKNHFSRLLMAWSSDEAEPDVGAMAPDKRVS